MTEVETPLQKPVAVLCQLCGEVEQHLNKLMSQTCDDWINTSFSVCKWICLVKIKLQEHHINKFPLTFAGTYCALHCCLHSEIAKIMFGFVCLWQTLLDCHASRLDLNTLDILNPSHPTLMICGSHNTTLTNTFSESQSANGNAKHCRMQNNRPHQINTCIGQTLKIYCGTSMTMMTSTLEIEISAHCENSAASAITSLRKFESLLCVCVNQPWPIILHSAVISKKCNPFSLLSPRYAPHRALGWD